MISKATLIRVFKGSLPARFQPLIWRFAFHTRSWLWSIKSFIPCSLLRRLPGSSRSFGPPRKLAHQADTAAGFVWGKEFYPPRQTIHKPSPNRVLPRESVYALPRSRETLSAKLVVVKNAQVLATKGAVISDKDEFITEFSVEHGRCHSPETALRHSLFSRWKLPQARQLTGTAFNFLTPGANNYYHWMHDALPRLELLRLAEFDFNQIDHWLVPAPLSSFHRETLNMLGVPLEKCIECSEGSLIKVDQLICATPIFAIGSPLWISSWLRRWAVDSLSSAPPSMKSRNRIFISRRNASSRRILNEPEVESLLNDWGFESVQLEAFTVREQMALFAAAEIIVAPHGAGLANLSFCKPGANVIELHTEAYFNALYMDLADASSLNHWAVVDTNVEGPKGSQMFADLRVNVSHLLQVLKDLEGEVGR